MLQPLYSPSKESSPAEQRTEEKPHYPGALTDVQALIIIGHTKRGQTFAAMSAYNRYRHGHEV